MPMPLKTSCTNAKRPPGIRHRVKTMARSEKAHWSANNARIEGYNVDHLQPHFGKMLLTDISADDVSRYQAARKKEGANGRTINMETGTLRAIIRSIEPGPIFSRMCES